MTTSTHHRYRTAYRVPEMGQTHLYFNPEAVGTYARVERKNRDYFNVQVGANLRRNEVLFTGESAHIWWDAFSGGSSVVLAGQWVVDYQNRREGGYIELARTRTIEAAIHQAVASLTAVGAEAGKW